MRETLHTTDETTNELRESDTDEDYPEIAIEECRPVEPEPQEPVTASDEDNDGETPNDDPQRVRQPPVRFGYNLPGNPALFRQAINTNGK